MTSRVSILLTRALGYIGAVLFIAVSCSQNVLHGFELGAARSETAAYIMAGGSLAGALIQPVAFLAALHSFRSWAFGKGIVALALGLACFVYATVSSLGFVSTSRDTATALRAHDADAYTLAKGRSDAALAELKTLAVAPAGNKKDQAARAARRKELEATVAEAGKAMGAGHGAGVSDPTATSLAAYASAAGFALRADTLSPWLSLLAVIFFEIGSAASLIVLSALPAVAKVAKPAPIQAATAPAAIAEPAPVAALGKARGRKRGTPLEKVRERIGAAGGVLEGSLDEIGQRLGLSKSGARRALHALAAIGSVSLASSAAGTLVQMRS